MQLRAKSQPTPQSISTARGGKRMLRVRIRMRYGRLLDIASEIWSRRWC